MDKGNPASYGKSVADETDLKYKQVYSSYSADNYGDAIWETSSNYSSGNMGQSYYGWNSDETSFPDENTSFVYGPYFLRGGDCSSSQGAGSFSFYYYDGDGATYASFRSVLVAL